MTHDDEKMLRAHTGTKHKAGDTDRWGMRELGGSRPGNYFDYFDLEN